MKTCKIKPEAIDQVSRRVPLDSEERYEVVCVRSDYGFTDIAYISTPRGVLCISVDKVYDIKDEEDKE